MANDAIPNLAEEELYKKRFIVTRRWRNILMWAFVICIIVIAVGYVRWNLVHKSFDHKMSLIDEAHKKEIVELKTALAYEQKDHVKAEGELKVLQKTMATLKTSDDLMVRDIELYIQARYRRVPKIVAHSIATNLVRVCNAEDVSPALVVGIVEIESQFNPMARNEKSKAIGLMQIMHEWVKKLGLKSVYDLYDIPTNIETGIKVLKIHIYEDAKGDIAKGLYFYVGKDKAYANKVFQAAGKFVVFRSTIDDDEKTIQEEPHNGNGKEEKKKDAVKPAEAIDGQHSS